MNDKQFLDENCERLRSKKEFITLLLLRLVFMFPQFSWIERMATNHEIGSSNLSGNANAFHRFRLKKRCSLFFFSAKKKILLVHELKLNATKQVYLTEIRGNSQAEIALCDSSQLIRQIKKDVITYVFLRDGRSGLALVSSPHGGGFQDFRSHGKILFYLIFS